MQKKRIIIVVIAGLLIIALAFVMINFKDLKNKGVAGFFADIFNPSAEKVLTAVTVDSESQEALAYEAHKNTIVYAGTQGVVGMNLSGEWLWDETSVSFLKPYIKSAGEYILVADLEGKYVLLFKNNVLVWKVEFPAGVISADINEKGYVAVAYNLENYDGAVAVIKPEANDDGNGKILFTNKINGEYVLSAVLSPNSEQVAVSGMSIEGETITGKISFINVSTGEIFSSINTEGNVFPAGTYTGKIDFMAVNANSLRLICRSHTASSDGDRDTDLWEKYSSYGDIYSFCVMNGQYIIVAAGNDVQGVYSSNTESRIVILDLAGNEVKTLKSSGTIKRVDSKGGIFAVSTDYHTDIYNSEFEKIYEYDTISEISKIIIIDENNFAAVTKKDIHILKAVSLNNK